MKSQGWSGLEIAEARMWSPVGQSIAEATAYSRVLPHCGCVVVVCRVEQQHLVFS
jgi:hypothetical protein